MLLLEATSQTRAIPSCEAVTMREQSGLNCALHTQLFSPARVAIGLQVVASQTRAVPS